jgi:DNA-binding response OmpR family regulator
VMALRRAVGDDPRRPRWIHTVRGHGYRLARADDD